MSTTSTSKTHRIARITITDHTGTHDGGEVRVHTSRDCSSCAHDGLKDVDWRLEGGMEFGRCMNLCGAIEEPAQAERWCEEHQTDAEFEAFVHRPHVPVFGVIEGGAA